jgi:hypothetical protein
MSVPSIPLDFQPAIIIGAARSGTNMLRDALVRLDGVATWPCDEINYIWRHGWASLPTDELLPAHATAHVRRYVRRAFRQVAQQTRAAWVVEKTCANSLRVAFVRAVLPEAKFIFLVRDGRDVVTSALKRWHAKFDVAYTLKKARFVPLGDLPYYALRFVRHRLHRLHSRERRLGSWGPRFAGIDELLATRSLADVCAEQWLRSVEQAAAGLASLPASQLYTVRYEDFVGRPGQELHTIARFLGVPAPSQRIAAIARNISTTSVGNWRAELDTSTIELIRGRLEPTLTRWGYVDGSAPAAVETRSRAA